MPHHGQFNPYPAKDEGRLITGWRILQDHFHNCCRRRGRSGILKGAIVPSSAISVRSSEREGRGSTARDCFETRYCHSVLCRSSFPGQFWLAQNSSKAAATSGGMPDSEAVSPNSDPSVGGSSSSPMFSFRKLISSLVNDPPWNKRSVNDCDLSTFYSDIVVAGALRDCRNAQNRPE